MQHCDPTTLALIGIGEAPPDDQSAQHLRSCAQCQAEVASFAHVTAVGRSITLADQPEDPPAHVWQAISATVAADAADGAADASESASETRSSAGDPPMETPTSLDDFKARRKRSRWLPLAAAAAVGAILGGSVIAGAVFEKDAQQAPTVIASGVLDPLPDGPDPQTTGKARLERSGNQYVLQVSANQLPPPAGFYEVWMMNPKTAGLVAVGTFNSNQTEATFTVPEGLPMTEYTSVDISDEPFDGVPGHSKVSVLRGNLSI